MVSLNADNASSSITKKKDPNPKPRDDNKQIFLKSHQS